MQQSLSLPCAGRFSFLNVRHFMQFLIVSSLLSFASGSAGASSTFRDEPTIETDEQGDLQILTQQGCDVLINDVGILDTITQLSQQLDALNNISQTSILPPLDPKIYVMQGRAAFPESSVELFDGDSWSSAPPMRKERFFYGAASYLGHIYVVGGMHESEDGQRVLFSSVVKFDGVEWTSGPSLPFARYRHCLVKYQGLLYATGGSLTNFESSTETVTAFDGVAWRPAPSMQTDRMGHGCAVFQGKLYVMGGESFALAGTTGYLSSVEAFDGTSWVDAPSMLSPRTQFGAAVFQGFLLAIGGHASGRTTEEVETFDGTVWRDNVAPKLRFRISNMATAVFGGKLYSIGGINDNTQLRNVLSISSLSDTQWSVDAALESPRSDCVAVVLSRP